MTLAKKKLPVSYYAETGFNVESTDTDEVMIEAQEGTPIALVYIVASNTTGAAETVTIKAGDVDDDPVVILEDVAVDDDENEVLLESTQVGLRIEGDLIVQASDTGVNISAWGVSG